MLGLIVMVIALATTWGASTVLANQRRDEAVTRMLSTISTVPDGTTLDLHAALDLEWDRAVVIGPYSPGSVANDAFGFDHYPANEVLTQGDGAYLLVFGLGRSFVADVLLNGQVFYFDEGVETFEAANARFRVTRDSGGVVLLTPAS